MVLCVLKLLIWLLRSDFQMIILYDKVIKIAIWLLLLLVDFMVVIVIVVVLNLSFQSAICFLFQDAAFSVISLHCILRICDWIVMCIYIWNKKTCLLLCPYWNENKTKIKLINQRQRQTVYGDEIKRNGKFYIVFG